MGYRLNGCNTGGIPTYLVERILKHCQVPVFIETGTANGDSVLWAANHFSECHTIELVEGRACQKEVANITWHTGNTTKVLPKLIDKLINDKGAELRRYAMFWLDAHYSGDTTNTSKYKECYLLEELEIISEYDQDAIILIDDARLFLGQPPHPNNPEDWCTIQQIFALINENFKYHYTTITDDYIISVPDRIKWVFDEDWRERYYLRYPSDAERLKTEVRTVYDALLNYIQ